jgi:hypothetical protein
MKTINCDGRCGLNEPVNMPKDRKTIKPVKFTVITDGRFPEGKTEYEADLCDDCEGRVLHNYFGVPAKGTLETPAFIEPTSLRVAE